jgi:hypothetical protein
VLAVIGQLYDRAGGPRQTAGSGFSAWAFGHPNQEAVALLVDPATGVSDTRPAVTKPVGLKGPCGGLVGGLIGRGVSRRVSAVLPVGRCGGSLRMLHARLMPSPRGDAGDAAGPLQSGSEPSGSSRAGVGTARVGVRAGGGSTLVHSTCRRWFCSAARWFCCKTQNGVPLAAGAVLVVNDTVAVARAIRRGLRDRFIAASVAV